MRGERERGGGREGGAERQRKDYREMNETVLTKLSVRDIIQIGICLHMPQKAETRLYSHVLPNLRTLLPMDKY